jgi:hypothetical protein
LLQRLCVGPDGADKLNKWTLGRPLAMRAIKSLMMPSRGTHPAITIAFPAAPKKSIWRLATRANGNMEPLPILNWTSARGNYPLNGHPGVERPCRNQTTINDIS